MKSVKIISRRSFAQITLAVVATAALAACGGGGGDDTSKVNLREAFNTIQFRMSRDEVRAVVGREEDDAASFNWTEGDTILRVSTQTFDDGVSRAIGVRLDVGGAVLIRDLARGE